MPYFCLISFYHVVSWWRSPLGKGDVHCLCFGLFSDFHPHLPALHFVSVPYWLTFALFFAWFPSTWLYLVEVSLRHGDVHGLCLGYISVISAGICSQAFLFPFCTVYQFASLSRFALFPSTWLGPGGGFPSAWRRSLLCLLLSISDSRRLCSLWPPCLHPVFRLLHVTRLALLFFGLDFVLPSRSLPPAAFSLACPWCGFFVEFEMLLSSHGSSNGCPLMSVMFRSFLILSSFYVTLLALCLMPLCWPFEVHRLISL